MKQKIILYSNKKNNNIIEKDIISKDIYNFKEFNLDNLINC